MSKEYVHIVPMYNTIEGLLPDTILLNVTEDDKEQIKDDPGYEITCEGRGIHKLPINNLEKNK
jgi:hypothetical protein